MPFTIPITDKQRETLNVLATQRQALQTSTDAYAQGIVDGASDAPKTWLGITLTAEGLMLGDAPPAPDISPAEPSA